MCQDTDYDYGAKDNYVYSLSDRKKLEDELSALGRIGYYAEFCENIPILVQAITAATGQSFVILPNVIILQQRSSATELHRTA